MHGVMLACRKVQMSCAIFKIIRIWLNAFPSVTPRKTLDCIAKNMWIPWKSCECGTKPWAFIQYWEIVWNLYRYVHMRAKMSCRTNEGPFIPMMLDGVEVRVLAIQAEKTISL